MKVGAGAMATLRQQRQSHIRGAGQTRGAAIGQFTTREGPWGSTLTVGKMGRRSGGAGTLVLSLILSLILIRILILILSLRLVTRSELSR